MSFFLVGSSGDNFLVFDGGLSLVNESEREELDLWETRVASITIAMWSCALLPTLRDSE